MRRAARVDDNQAEIVAALRAAGCTVQSLAAVGRGCPDLLVGRTRSTGTQRNYLLEIKDGAKPPSRRKLTPDEQAWHAAWRGQVAVVESVDEALEVCCG
jgi:arginine repressor